MLQVREVIPMETSPRGACQGLLRAEESGVLSVLQLQEQSQVECEVAYEENPRERIRDEITLLTDSDLQYMSPSPCSSIKQLFILFRSLDCCL